MGAALGVKVGPMLPDTEEVMRHFLRANVDLIKTIPKRHLDSLYRGLGRLAETDAFDRSKVEALLSQSFGSSGYNLRRLTRDQTSKLSSQLDRVRQQAVGVEQYRWLTSGDERVRDEHQANSGRVFSWKEAPSTGHPGDAIQCRCVAEPVIPLAPRSTAPNPSRSETAIPPVAKAPPKPDYRAADADPEAVRVALLAQAARMERRRAKLTARLRKSLDEINARISSLSDEIVFADSERRRAISRELVPLFDREETLKKRLQVLDKVTGARKLRERFILRERSDGAKWLPGLNVEGGPPGFERGVREALGRLYHAAPDYGESKVLVQFASGRAFARRTPGGARVMLDNQKGIETAIHEFTHTVEIADKRWFQNSVDELFRRTRGESVELLSELTGKPYGPNEYARRDRFGGGGKGFPKSESEKMWIYAGKDYTRKSADAVAGDVISPWDSGFSVYGTEMLTMGVEFLWNDPARLAREEPDLFRWALRTIRRGPGQ